MQMNVDKGVRASASQAYLRPALGRENLTLLKNTQVKRIIFNGKKLWVFEYSAERMPGSYP